MYSDEATTIAAQMFNDTLAASEPNGIFATFGNLRSENQTKVVDAMRAALATLPKLEVDEGMAFKLRTWVAEKTKHFATIAECQAVLEQLLTPPPSVPEPTLGDRQMFAHTLVNVLKVPDLTGWTDERIATAIKAVWAMDQDKEGRQP